MAEHTLVRVRKGGKLLLEEFSTVTKEVLREVLHGEIEQIPLEGPDGPGPFTAIIRKGGWNAEDERFTKNALIPRGYFEEPDTWISGPILVAIRQKNGHLRGLAEAEQRQVQIWYSGYDRQPQPLLMVEDPE